MSSNEDIARIVDLLRGLFTVYPQNSSENPLHRGHLFVCKGSGCVYQSPARASQTIQHHAATHLEQSVSLQTLSIPITYNRKYAPTK